MKTGIALAIVFAASTALASPVVHGPATPGSGTYQYEPTRDIKWAQLPMIGGVAVSSQYDSEYPFYSECADDFLCGDDDPILAIEWWGDYWNGSPFPPDYFIIRFYANASASPQGQPLDPALHEEVCYDYDQTYYPEYDQYRYFCEFQYPFFPEAGNIYWASVQAALVWPPQWGWSECGGAYSWNEESVLDFALLGVTRWTPISMVPGITPTRKDLAFVLHGPFTPVEDSTWGNIKALYR